MGLRFTLLQIRDPEDPIRSQEVRAFANALGCDRDAIDVFDLLSGVPSTSQMNATNAFLIGGSGRYSATANEPWLDRGLDFMRQLHSESKPTFASCWGFQAMARALGGKVIHDLDNAELGCHQIMLTKKGESDPIFGPTGKQFQGFMGHEDRVVDLPDGAELLASSERVENQAYRFVGKPIYATQFHPELGRNDFLERVRVYPEYIERIAGVDYESFAASCDDTPESRSILQRFVATVFG